MTKITAIKTDPLTTVYKFALGQIVQVKASGGDGIIATVTGRSDSMMFAPTYRIEFWGNGNRYEYWVLADELKGV